MDDLIGNCSRKLRGSGLGPRGGGRGSGSG